MKILLTGASGFLGNSIFDALIKWGHFVDTLGRSNENSIQADLAKSLEKLNTQYDVVIHAAGKAHMVPKTQRRKIFSTM